MQNKQPVADFMGKGSFDTTGKGFELPSPIEGLDQRNRASISGPGRSVGSNSMGMGAPVSRGYSEVEEPEMEEGMEDEDEMSAEQSLKEHLAALFANTNLSEDFIEKAKTIFVAAVNEKVGEATRQIAEHYENEYNNALEGMVDQLTEKVDDYLTYVVEEWVTENKLQVERGLKVELAENFIFGLKKLFENNFIDVPDEKYDVLDELYETIDNQNLELNNVINANVTLRKRIMESASVAIFAEETRGLAATQVEKLKNLCEGIEYESPEMFRDKLRIIKESFLRSQVVPAPRLPAISPVVPARSLPSVDILETSTQPEVITEGVMNQYTRALSRHTKK